MNASRNSWYGILIAVISVLMVLGALMTALAQSEFRIEPETVGQPTATFLNVPTKTTTADENPTVSPTEEDTDTQGEQPTATDTPDDQQATATDTQQATTNTPYTFTPTLFQSGSECGVPGGWIKYTVKSGDTLFSISIKFQTTVYEIKNANCLVSNTIITGSTLWVPNNPTITPTKTKVPTSTPKPTATKTPTVTCYGLTLSVVSGSGSAPSVSPTKSDGCTSGKYTAGETITLTAKPDTNWKVSAWSGTDNDASTSNSNTLTMPAKAQAVSVTYSQICYTLNLSVGSGSGAAPSASPTNSTGCAAGKYHAGESINLTAVPDSGWNVSGWNGTENDASTATTNALTMPASNHAVSVNYSAVCYTLNLSVSSGNGSVPAATPSSSSGCAAGTFHAGESISLSVTPDSGWTVSGWSGTDNDASTASTNTLTMPASSHAASVTYEVISPP
ncbi:MAG TPA: LysM peptidoglycan-binding domain-containing protein [Anaerolineales bacterium]|nr:LysM peptidoglycan-binding domain-containing protein [Anaerolineales bacterium]